VKTIQIGADPGARITVTVIVHRRGKQVIPGRARKGPGKRGEALTERPLSRTKPRLFLLCPTST
jgi:hypothetical protein